MRSDARTRALAGVITEPPASDRQDRRNRNPRDPHRLRPSAANIPALRLVGKANLAAEFAHPPPRGWRTRRRL